MVGIGLLGIIGAIMAFMRMIIAWIPPFLAGTIAAAELCFRYGGEFLYQLLDIIF